MCGVNAGIHPAEASHLDYQQSQVLETTWHALEDAGLDPTSLAERRVGVYVGAISHEFAVLEAFRHEPSTYAATGVSTSLVANRVSYVLGLRGPSVVVDTACSSSLVAVHDAVRDLRLGACVSDPIENRSQ
jgi:acyl transferase domain-containing protein